MNHFLSSIASSLPLILTLLAAASSIDLVQSKLPGLRVHQDTLVADKAHSSAASKKVVSGLSDDYKTHFYEQTLDHFNYRPEGYAKFNQRYVTNSKYWGGGDANAPIFAYLGAEGPVDRDIPIIGFLPDNAQRFNALLVYIEHRYYGQSLPFGSRENAYKDASTLGYFNSAQAIADYAAILIHIKQKFRAQDSPIIVIGGSYGGMLASWFRLKYPHIALGALASSAPVLYFDDMTPQNGYYSIVANDFLDESENCYETIRKSWSEIDRVASQSNGLAILSKKFHTCEHLNHSFELKNFLDTTYATVAQYNNPPNYPLKMLCSGIDRASERTDDILERLYQGLVGYKWNSSCVNTYYYSATTETSVGWGWQICSEMVMPIGRDGNVTMFPPAPFDLDYYLQWCYQKYGVYPRPHWVTTYYGGHDIELILGKFGSNIIFSNGLKDPYSSGGVLKDISDSVVAVSTMNGAHCSDILKARPTDPEWLIQQRDEEIKIIEGWIDEYQSDLAESKIVE